MLPILKNQKSDDKGAPVVPARENEGASHPPLHFDGNKINFISLGCPRNLVDSEVMLGILLKAGYEVAPTLEEADYIVINTCGFLEASRQESMDTVQDVLAHRKKTAKLIVTGCMVQTHSDALKGTFPGIDYLLGSGDVEGILQAVQSTQKGQIVSSAKSYLEAGEVPRRLSTPKHYAYLKIAEGCRKRCAYCIIPTIKGPLKSKGKEQIMKEFNLLLNQGVQEIILIAQDLGDYGKETGSKNLAALLDLLKTMLSVDKPFWLRLLYLYPDEITDELIALMKSDARICPYLDMPIQHINNQMLKSMRRMTSKEDIIAIITKLRREIPDVSIRTSLIVGFPGETDEQFEELVQFIQDYPLDNVGIFKFSREPGSAAYDMANQVSDEVKEKRYHRLMQVQKKVIKKHLKKMVGKKIPVMVEGYHPETQLLMVGRHRGQCPDIDGQVLINDGRKVKSFGQIYTVEITDFSDYDLVGRVL
ncbi:30S ribosomal protein S12 methylthiotransferase RimO [Candidatus Protochlamydia phocaeensis]|uniref:30S ribosomal protein S12 methylthiotransferase RimO n=1 Tax=Candidatus Protochlamydia phocaeensis TaxID=1414722 RepID=UPI0009AD7CF7|nr:30S ribosomal protein S12 methylthiotransferase RimO [Candidatus Protochlamydia phocaeensis]